MKNPDESELEEDIALRELLRALPPPPKVSTNFTALVLQEIQGKPAPARSRWQSLIRWPIWATATAAILLMAVLDQRQQKRSELARSAETVAAVASKGIPPEVFKDFEVIRNLPEAGPTVDFALLTALGSE